jgi:hypothetical protein
MPTFAFQQVDVFTSKRFKGNPLAVVIGADGLSDDTMAALASWTNLSETTFLLKPTSPEADYRLRIFTRRANYRLPVIRRWAVAMSGSAPATAPNRLISCRNAPSDLSGSSVTETGSPSPPSSAPHRPC